LLKYSTAQSITLYHVIKDKEFILYMTEEK